MKNVIAIISVSVALTACAGIPLKPEQVASRIDPISISNQTLYEHDVKECTDLSNKLTKNAAWRAFFQGLAAAAAGAAAGSAIGGITHTNVGRAAGVGAVAAGTAGITGGMLKGMNKKQTIVYRCLIHRGYALLY